VLPRPRNTGTSSPVVSKECSGLDIGAAIPESPSQSGRCAFTQAAVIERGTDYRRWLRDRPDALIAATSHCSFLQLDVSTGQNVHGRISILRLTLIIDQWNGQQEKGMGVAPGKVLKGECRPSLRLDYLWREVVGYTSRVVTEGKSRDYINLT